MNLFVGEEVEDIKKLRTQEECMFITVIVRVNAMKFVATTNSLCRPVVFAPLLR